MTSADGVQILHGVGRTVSYLGVAVVLLAGGYHVLDMLTPGKLAEVIMTERNHNAARVASATTLSLAIVIATAVVTTHDDFAYGLVSTAVFGAVGVILQTVVYLLFDLLTPGRLGDVVCDPQEHPGSWLLAASLVASGVVVAACIS